MKRPLLFLLGIFGLTGCTGIPHGIEPVDGIDVNRYLGRWYEIARLDHSFERGLSNVTADYSLRSDGGIDVLNRGYDREKGAWKDAEGKAYFLGEKDVGRLKVSFLALSTEGTTSLPSTGRTTPGRWSAARS